MRGEAHYAKGDYDGAIADFSEAIRLDPKFAIAFSGRGLAYSAKGDHDRAIADFNEAIRLDPKSRIAFYNRGLAYDAKGGLRPRHRRLYRGDPARSQIRRGVRPALSSSRPAIPLLRSRPHRNHTEHTQPRNKF